jgi:RimJ/RimL family protein N-acetyltransferase
MKDSAGMNTAIGNSFPPHDVSPLEKSRDIWGVQGAKAIWYFNDNNSPVMFYNDRESHDTYLKYAFGEQDQEITKPALGINARNQEQSFLGGIRWQIKNFATKRIQATASKIFGRKYDPVASAIDPTSSDRRESFKASVQTWAKEQSWLMERQTMLGIDLSPGGVDISNLPTNDEALNIFMQDYKLVNEINAEVGIKYHLDRLDFDMAIKEKMDQYITMLPAAAVWVGLDSNNLPDIKVLNPSRVLAPKSEFNDFKRIGYGAYIDEYTVAEFRSMVNGEIPEEEMKLLIDSHSNRGNYETMRFNTNYPQIQRDVDTISIMHFEIATVDEYVFLSKKDKFSNERFVPKPFDYFRSNPEDFKTRYRSERKIYRVPKKTVYGGYWIVGSDTVFGYGEKNHNRGEIGYKMRASNSISGYSTCMVRQMKPCLDNLETYDKKIQQLVASAIPNGIKIDLFALRKASFMMNGKAMQTEDLLSLFFQKGVIVTDTSDSPSGDTRKPIEVFPIGISNDLVKFMELMRMELEHLDEITGYNRVSSGTTLSPETGARVAQQMDDATDTNLDHLYRADRSLCSQIYSSLGHLHVESVRINPDYYIKVLGEEAVIKILTGYHSEEIGVSIEARPTTLEWNQFYAEITELVRAEKIEPADRVALRRFQSLKEAEAYLRVVTEKRRKEKMQEQSMLIQQTGEVQKQSNEQTTQNSLLLEREKRATIQMQMAGDADLRDKEHRYKMEELRLQYTLINQGKLATAAVEGHTALSVASKKSSSE